MFKKIFLIFLVILFSVSLLELNASEIKGLKKRVAVFKFEDKTDHAFHWWTGQPVGEGMADMLITALVQTGKYTILERTELDVVLKEQALGQSGMVTAETAAQVGKLLGVELAIVGAVTEFGHEKGGTGGRIKGFGLGVKTLGATVAVDVRFINTTTGEILDAKNARSEKKSRSLSVSTPKVDFDNQKSFDESLVGEACRDAITQIVSMIDDQMNNIPWQGKIVKADGKSVIINAGSASGIQNGMEFVVYAPGEELVDPDTGLSLGSEDTRVGKIKVTNNNLGGKGKASQCTVIEGTGFDRGHLVREQ
ncbi:hypothetical protein JW964_22175 [candidate division KSB1 bacterium]|nr:hypothetical protein [candidate division KSB1 bacterium]